MAVDGGLGPRQQPQFLDGGPPDLAVDQNAVADYAAEFGNHVVGTTAERVEATSWAWEGLLWFDTTAKAVYWFNGTAWGAEGGRSAPLTTVGSVWGFVVTGALETRVRASGGRVFLQGGVTNVVSAEVSFGTEYQVGTVPIEFAPAASVRFVTLAAGNGSALVRVASNGTVYFTPQFGGTYPAGVLTGWLDGMNWPDKSAP